MCWMEIWKSLEYLCPEVRTKIRKNIYGLLPMIRSASCLQERNKLCFFYQYCFTLAQLIVGGKLWAPCVYVCMRLLTSYICVGESAALTLPSFIFPLLFNEATSSRLDADWQCCLGCNGLLHMHTRAHTRTQRHKKTRAKVLSCRFFFFFFIFCFWIAWLVFWCTVVLLNYWSGVGSSRHLDNGTKGSQRPKESFGMSFKNFS